MSVVAGQFIVRGDLEGEDTLCSNCEQVTVDGIVECECGDPGWEIGISRFHRSNSREVFLNSEAQFGKHGIVVIGREYRDDKVLG